MNGTALTSNIATQQAVCSNGYEWCIEGSPQHGACQGPLLTVYVPGHRGPVPTLDAQIMDNGEGPVLSFSGDSHDGCEITSAKLRGVVADILAHASRLLAIAEQFDALPATA